MDHISNHALVLIGSITYCLLIVTINGSFFVDADEFLTFDIGDGKLCDLIAELERNGRKSAQSLMLDMYSDAPGGVPHCVNEGQDPLETSPYYDSRGYYISREVSSNTTWIKGGVRNRLFFDKVGSGPALNKTPLVKWKRHYAFLKSAHQGLADPRSTA